MNTITYLKEVPMINKVVGFALMGIGLFALTQLSFLNFGIPFFIGLNFVATEGSQINLDNNTFRSIKSLFGIHFGKWVPCPAYEYISVFRTKENKTIRVITAETTWRNKVFVVNLFYAGNKYHTLYKSSDKEDAFRMAEHLKMVFNIDILDATESERKWL